MDHTPDFIHKLGTIDGDIVEANPIVWRDKLYIFEYIRYQSETKRYYGNREHASYFRFLDVETGVPGPAFGHGLHMGNAFATPDRIIVTAVENWGKSRFYELQSDDLVHWTSPRVILENPAWEGYNTSVCRTDSGYVMAFELGAPSDLVGVPFTMFFAESTDLVQWRTIPGAVFGRDIYTGGPMLRWFDGYYYMFYLGGGYDRGFETVVARSRDLQHWVWSERNPVLGYGDADRVADPTCPASQQARLADAENINASDLDMCEFQGRLEFVYSWGNQRGTEFLARATASGLTERQFCERFF